MKYSGLIRKNEKGVTFVELMIVVAVIAIMVAFSVPAIIQWMPDYRLKKAGRDIYSNFQRARAEAIKRNTDVVFSFTAAAFVPEGGVGSYIIFVDDGSGGGTAGDDIQNGTERLLSQRTMPNDVSLTTATFNGTTVPGYNSRGLPLGTPARTGNVIVQNNNFKQYMVSLSAAGNLDLQFSNDNGVTWN